MADPELGKARQAIPDLFRDIEVYESLVLGENIFFIHGHQGDLINDALVGLARFFVRSFWRRSQTRFGIKDPTSTARNYVKRNKIEQKIYNWALSHRRIVIAGHTHRPMFESLSKQDRLHQGSPTPYYFNCGSGVHPRCITCLEIEKMEIRLVKWHFDVEKGDRNVRICRTEIPGCRALLADLNAGL